MTTTDLDVTSRAAQFAATLGTPISPDDPLAAEFRSLQPPTSAESLDMDDDDDEEEEKDPRKNATKHTVATSGFTKTALIAGGGFLLICGVGLFMGNFSAKPKVEAVVQASPTDSPEVSPEVGNSQTKVALALQTQEKSLAEQVPSKEPQGTAKTTSATSKPTAAKPTTPVSTGASTNAQARPAPTSTPVQSRPSESPKPEVKPDPIAEWARLAQAGGYGMAPTFSPTVTSAPLAVVTPTTPSTPAKSSSAPTNPLIPANLPSLSTYANPMGTAVATAYQEVGYPSQNSQSRTLLIGTTTRATLSTPAVWSGSGSAPAFGGNSPKFIVILDEPLKDTSGLVVIPQGAKLVATVRPLDPRTGMAEMDTLQVIINGKEYAPPPGAITIRGDDGGPLIAQQYMDKGATIGGMDAGLMFASALAKVGEISNQQSSSSSVSSIGTATTTTTSPPPNYMGALLQGGFGVLSKQLEERNKAAIEEVLKQPNIWFIGAGKRVQVFINTTVQL